MSGEAAGRGRGGGRVKGAGVPQGGQLWGEAVPAAGRVQGAGLGAASACRTGAARL